MQVSQMVDSSCPCHRQQSKKGKGRVNGQIKQLQETVTANGLTKWRGKRFLFCHHGTWNFNFSHINLVQEISSWFQTTLARLCHPLSLSKRPKSSNPQSKLSRVSGIKTCQIRQKTQETAQMLLQTPWQLLKA